MSEPFLTVVPDVRLTSAQIAERMSRALLGRAVPVRQVVAVDRQASPTEGLALVEYLLAIRDPDVRQALLDAASTLAADGR